MSAGKIAVLGGENSFLRLLQKLVRSRCFLRIRLSLLDFKAFLLSLIKNCNKHLAKMQVFLPRLNLGRNLGEKLLWQTLSQQRESITGL
jgi:hypothetical protein